MKDTVTNKNIVSYLYKLQINWRLTITNYSYSTTLLKIWDKIIGGHLIPEQHFNKVSIVCLIERWFY